MAIARLDASQESFAAFMVSISAFAFRSLRGIATAFCFVVIDGFAVSIPSAIAPNDLVESSYWMMTKYILFVNSRMLVYVYPPTPR